MKHERRVTYFDHSVDRCIRRRRFLVEQERVELTKIGGTHAYDGHTNIDYDRRRRPCIDCSCGIDHLQEEAIS